MGVEMVKWVAVVLSGLLVAAAGALPGPVAAQTELPEERVPVIEVPKEDQDFGAVARVGEAAIDRSLVPEPIIDSFASDFDRSRLDGVASERSETIRFEVSGVGEVVATFVPERDPLANAPWPGIELPEDSVQRSGPPIRVSSEAWIDGLPGQVIISEGRDDGGTQIVVSRIGERIDIGPCEDKDVARTCVVHRESRVVEPGGIEDDSTASKGNEASTDNDPDPLIGVKTEELEIEGRNGRAIVQRSGVDPEIDILVVRVGGASATDIALELANAEAGSDAQGLNFGWQIVDTMTVAWPAGGAITDADTILSQIRNPTDGIWDDVAAQRDAVAADLILVVVSIDLERNGNNVIGTVGTNGIPAAVHSGTRNDFHAAVVRSTSSAGSDRDADDLTVPHELGHLLTMHHDWCSDDSAGYDHGFVMPSQGATQLRTIMAARGSNRGGTCSIATSDDARIPRWSTQDGDTFLEVILTSPFVNSVPLGTGDARSDLSGNQVTDNERTWEDEAWDIARYRVADVCPFGTNGFSQSNGTASSPARLVTQQYLDILNRNPDSYGLNWWEAQIVNGNFNGSDVILEFVRSPEFEGTFAEVIRMYQVLQGRIADVGGLNYWSQTNTNRLVLAGSLLADNNPINWSAMTDGQFIDTLWPRAVGYSPSSGNRTTWLNRLANGSWTRARIAEWITGHSQSENHMRNTVDASMLYYGMLDRAPDGSGLTFWRNQLDSGVAYLDVISNFRYAPEYAQRLGLPTC